MTGLRRAILVACISLAAGGCDRAPTVELTVRAAGLADDTAATVRELRFHFSGAEEFEARRALPGGLRTEERVRYVPQPETRGRIRIDLEALDGDGVVVARGAGEAELDGERVELEILLGPGPTPDMAVEDLPLPPDAAVPDLTTSPSDLAGPFVAVALYVRQDGVPDGGLGLANAAANGVLEPGERAVLVPSWRNASGAPAMLSATATQFTGPAPGVFTLLDASGSYGTVAAGTTATCDDCFGVEWSTVTRGAGHLDATFSEVVTGAAAARQWSVHLGRSFVDVPESNPSYVAVETLLHLGAIAGCSSDSYCVDSSLTFAAAAIFIARLALPAGTALPTAGTIDGTPYSCASGGASVFTDVAPTDGSCASIHYLRARNIALGCGGTSFCPTAAAPRQNLYNWLARLVAPTSGVPLSYTDLATGRSYSCDVAAPDLQFTDVAAGGFFCQGVHYLWARGDLEGCTATTACPTAGVSRGVGAEIIVRALRARLDGR